MINAILKIGKSDTNNLVIKYGKISRQHCSVKQVSETEFVIEDLDSSNGTYINGRRIKQTLLKPDDQLQLADFSINVHLLLLLFSENKLPVGMLYEQLLKKIDEQKAQILIFEEFTKLKEIYEKHLAAKKKIMRGDTLKKTGIRAGLSLIPLIGMALGQLSGTVGNSIQEKVMELDEEFKKNYVCPKCFKFLGAEPYENLEKRGFCFYCKTKWIKE